jgi:hypothetical protein
MDRMAERDWLNGLITNIQGYRARDRQKHRAAVKSATTNNQNAQQCQELICPSREYKALHISTVTNLN